LPLTSRRLKWPDCHNTRDLGGLPRPGGATRSGVFVRSDCMTNLTAAGLEAMGAYGVATVLDLRTPAELLRAPNPCAERAHPAYLNLPLIDEALMLKLENAPGMLERYLLMLDESRQSFGTIFNFLGEADDCVLVHCFAGKDRTGLVAAMMLELAGVPRDSIVLDFAESEDRLATRFEEWLAAAAPERRAVMREDLRCPPERMAGALDHLQSRWGGVAAYLEAAGVTQPNLDRLASKLT
jgi:protein-tyrosine phosphatase